MVSRFFMKKGQSDSPPKEAAGRPPDRGAGLGSRYGGGATIPVCGDFPAPPKKKRSLVPCTVMVDVAMAPDTAKAIALVLGVAIVSEAAWCWRPG